MNGNNFDRLEFIQNERNFKELGQSDNVLKDREPRQDWKPPLLLKIIAIVLAVVLLVVLAFSIFVHPVDRMKLAIAIARSYEINMVASFGFITEEVTIKVDGRYMSVARGRNAKNIEYYVMDGDTVYTYKQDKSGEWQKALLDDGLYVDAGEFEVLFDSRNYNRAKGLRPGWELKEGVTFDTFDEVEFVREFGRYKVKATDYINNRNYDVYLTITIGRIGRTRVTLPWTE